MKSTGITRRVDELGRIVLPVEMRRTLEIEERDPLEITLEGDCILLRKQHAACLFCGASEDLLQYKSKPLCRTCLRDINELDE